MMRAIRTARRRFCLVTTAHICNNPRLVKEADALHAAGCAVRVVAPLYDTALIARDAAVMASRQWRLDYVDARRSTAAGLLRRFGWGALQRLSERLFDANTLPTV